MAGRVKCGDVNTTRSSGRSEAKASCAKFDTHTGRPYNRLDKVVGSKAAHYGYPSRMYVDHGPSWSHRWLEDADTAEMQDRYAHPLWTRLQALAAEHKQGHGGMDFIMMYRLIRCLNQGLPLDLNVYDGVMWSMVGILGEESVSRGSVRVDVPDLTGGRWRKAVPAPRTGTSAEPPHRERAHSKPSRMGARHRCRRPPWPADDGHGHPGRLQLGHGLCIGQLAGAEDHVVDVKELLLTPHFDAQSAGLDGLVGHTGNGLHSALAKGETVNPAGGLAQTLARFAFLALEQVNLPRRLWSARRLQPSLRLDISIDAPAGPEPVHGLLAMRMGQEIGHIEPNASSADERHTIPDFDLTAENGVIRHGVGQIGPRYGRHPRPHAGAPGDGRGWPSSRAFLTSSSPNCRLR